MASNMQKMHRTVSPNGRFDFNVPTSKGYMRIDKTWSDTWEDYSSRMFRNDITWVQKVRAQDLELNEVAEEFFANVVPRLLRPFQTARRSIEPVLVHGDMWNDDMEMDTDNRKLTVFDGCCCYGHSAYKLFYTGVVPHGCSD